jgi:hypothetical protein
MSRRLDLQALDAALTRLGVDLDDDDETAVENDNDDPDENRYDVYDDPNDGTYDQRNDEPDRSNTGAFGGEPFDVWATRNTADSRSGQHSRTGEQAHRPRSYAPPARVRGDRRPTTRGTRPNDLPSLHIPSGYRRDRRGTWRYVDGGAVPGARDVTIATLWNFGAKRPVVVPDDTARAAPELAWCRLAGEPTEIAVRTAGRQTTGTKKAKRSVIIAAWVIDDDAWDDHAGWPLTITAPELTTERLWGVGDISKWLALTPSTVTSYLSRGLLPEPQVRVGGRPAWSLPILLAWHRRTAST